MTAVHMTIVIIAASKPSSRESGAAQYYNNFNKQYWFAQRSKVQSTGSVELTELRAAKSYGGQRGYVSPRDPYSPTPKPGESVACGLGLGLGLGLLGLELEKVFFSISDLKNSEAGHPPGSQPSNKGPKTGGGVINHKTAGRLHGKTPCGR